MINLEMEKNQSNYDKEAFTDEPAPKRGGKSPSSLKYSRSSSIDNGHYSMEAE